jgi:hypothetical protein
MDEGGGGRERERERDSGKNTLERAEIHSREQTINQNGASGNWHENISPQAL